MEGADARPGWEERWPPPTYWMKVGLTLVGVVTGR
jgi:hypothetical protein